MDYKMTIAGVERALPLCPLNDKLQIGAFVMFGDVELTVACAEALLKKAPEYDVLITAESKGIPLAYEMARQQNRSTDCDFQNPSMDFDIWTGEVQHGDLLTLKSRFRLGEFISLFFFSQKLSGIYTLIKPQPFWEMKT